MGKVVAEKELVLVVEMMIEPARSLISARVVGKQASVVLKLINEKGAERVGGRIERQSSIQNGRASCWRHVRRGVGSRETQFCRHGRAHGTAQTRHGAGIA